MPRLPLRLLFLAAILLVTLGPAARADEYVDRVNALFADVAPAKRSDLIILPLLAKLDPVPAGLAEFPRAMLLQPGMNGWDPAVAWAQAEPQKAILAAIAAVTKEDDPQSAMVFAQPYGVEGVPIELVQAKLYTELGDPPTLAGARFYYLPALQNVELLVQVEAGRQLAAGDALGAIQTLVNWTFFARQLADRPFATESRFGLIAMVRSFERLRDVAYDDFRGSKSLRPAASEALVKIIDRLEPERGLLCIPRLRLPTAHRAAVEQLVARTFVPRGEVNKAVFATTMARMGSTERPLRLFGEAGAWQARAAAHANWFDTTEQIPKVFDDWTSRWTLDPFDARMRQAFTYDSLQRQRFAVIAEVTPNLAEFFALRQQLRTEIVGTRAALGLLGFYYANSGFAPQIQSMRPRFMKVIEADPYNPNRASGQRPPLEYFVPMRDQSVGAREEKKPHEISVFVPGGENFLVRLRDDTFVLYSVGPDGGNNFARRVEVTRQPVADSDYLLWPPIMSLYRQALADKGQLK